MQEMWVQFLGQEDTSGEGNGKPFQYFCLGNPMDRGACQAPNGQELYSPWGYKRLGRDLATE